MSQTQTESIYNIYYTGDGTRDGSLGGAPSNVRLNSGLLNNFFARVTDSLAFTGGFKYHAFILKNDSQSKVSLKTSLYVEMPPTNTNISIAIAISSTGLNQNPVELDDEDTDPLTEDFQPYLGRPTIFNIGKLGPQDFIGFFVRLRVEAGTNTPANAITAVISAHGESEPVTVENPQPEPCPANHHRDDNGQCIPNDCPAGQIWDPTANNGFGACVDDDTPIVCEAGFHYDETLQQCVPDANEPPPIAKVLKIAAAGDFDCNSNTDRTFDNIITRVPFLASQGLPLGYVLLLGDLSYGSSQDCFIDRCRNRLGDLFPSSIFPTIGNHDHNESGSRSKENAVYSAFTAIQDPGIYSLTVFSLRIIIMNTQEDYDDESIQYEFVVQQLLNAKQDPNIKWIIVMYHKPSIVSDDPDHNPITAIRDDYHPLFDLYGVDLVLNGHNHVYHRSYPIKYNSGSPSNPTIVNSGPGPYTNVDGRIFATVGTGGRRLDDFSGSQESYIATREEQFGVLHISMDFDNNIMRCEFVENTGQISDTFEIRK